MALSDSEMSRYSRHLSLPNFGLEAQQELKNTRVLVIGAGGLGAPLLQYLCAAGVGTIGVVDFDVVDETNLQRQVLFDPKDVGSPKAATAIRKLRQQNPHVHFVEHPVKLDASNAMAIIEAYDIVADGTDNFPTRYLVNDACVLAGKPLVYGSIYRFEGQVSVFNLPDANGLGPNYRDLFPTPPAPGTVPNCEEGGVLGVLPGIIGSMQANEVIKIAAGIGTTLSGKLFLLDALDFSTRTISFAKDPANPISGETPSIRALIDYEAFCGIKKNDSIMKEMTVEELHNLQQAGEAFHLIDVREPDEYNAGNMGAKSMPLSRLDDFADQIPQEGTVVIHCKRGGRSAQAIQRLSETYGHSNLINLKGGILDWQQQYAQDLFVL